jgi:hypothetical protein
VLQPGRAARFRRPLPAPRPAVAGPAVVELVHQLGLVERQVPLLPAREHVPAQGEPGPLELLARAEEAGVVGHVEHAPERDVPRVPGRVVLAHQDGDAPVDGAGQLRLVGRAEDRAGAGIGVEEPKVFRHQSEAARLVAQLFGPLEEEGEAGRLRMLALGQRQQAELITPMHTGKDRLPVLEVEQADQGALDERLEQHLGGVVGGDVARHDQPGAATGGQELPGQLGEHLVGVEVAASAERETAALPAEVAHLLRLPQGGAIGGGELGVASPGGCR